jgi:hypothetical protein
MHQEAVGHPPQRVLRALREWRASERELDPSYSDSTKIRPFRPRSVQPAGNTAGEDNSSDQHPI